MSGECAAGRHATCPGYYKLAHPCPCPCHVACEHPATAARWDDHRALLLCTACGRKIEAESSENPGPVHPGSLDFFDSLRK